MGKRQIQVRQADVKELVREAIQDRLNGVFSTDDPKAADAVRNDVDFYDDWYGEDYNRRKNREDLANLIDKRANGEDAELDMPNRYKSRLGDEYDSDGSKEESELYDKPFGDLDDAENQWNSEPGYEDNDDDDIAGVNEGRRRIALSEQGLRNFISYSVARILKESIGEENLGIMTHFGGEDSRRAAENYPNPYKDMTWDEYVEAKRKEREEDAQGDEPNDGKPNLGITTHFGGKKDERTPEDIERDEHMFDDDYWARKADAQKGELMEMEGPEDDGKEEVKEQFPKKANGTFTMKTRTGRTDKYRVFVEKTDNEELLTDIFIYDPMDREWYPQAEYVVGIEEYLNGSWLPYWETFNGDVSMRALANCFDKVVKLWKKVGYLYEEDDEIPFRYSGDYMKGAPKGMF